MKAQITAFGEPGSLIEDLLEVGQAAPEVKVVQNNYQELIIGGAKDKPQLILTVPTLDGDVCPKEIEQFDEVLRDLSGKIYTFVVSMDLPHAQRRYCVIYDIQNLQILSDFRHRDMRKYGVFIANGVLQGLLARAAFVVDSGGKITYVQLVTEQTDEPDYDAVRQAVEAVLVKSR